MAETSPWDTADPLDTPEEIAAYLEAAFEAGDPAFFTDALGIVARAKGLLILIKMSALAADEILGVLAYMTGQVCALLDSRKFDPAVARNIVMVNLAKGNDDAIAARLERKPPH